MKSRKAPPSCPCDLFGDRLTTVTTIEVDEDGDAAPHPASPGDRLVIRLAESPSSGCSWQVGEYDPAVLEPAGDEFVAAADSMTGGCTREFHFAVVAAGHSNVAFSLRHAWEAEVAAAQRFQTAIN